MGQLAWHIPALHRPPELYYYMVKGYIREFESASYGVWVEARGTVVVERGAYK